MDIQRDIVAARHGHLEDHGFGGVPRLRNPFQQPACAQGLDRIARLTRQTERLANRMVRGADRLVLANDQHANGQRIHHFGESPNRIWRLTGNRRERL